MATTSTQASEACHGVCTQTADAPTGFFFFEFSSVPCLIKLHQTPQKGGTEVEMPVTSAASTGTDLSHMARWRWIPEAQRGTGEPEQLTC
mmetsp:Transcript_34895/g.57076  ORF Transcript_34895/g.57076 Transcript_34895/m.57076 type:complete len:90 (-) Transcript_34895:873-1142(-)